MGIEGLRDLGIEGFRNLGIGELRDIGINGLMYKVFLLKEVSMITYEGREVR